MLQPINYVLQGKEPMDAFFGGIKQWHDMKNDEAIVAKQALLKQQEQEKQQRQRMAYDELDKLDFNDMNALMAFHGRFPEYSKGAIDVYHQLSAKQQQAQLAQVSKLYSMAQHDTQQAGDYAEHLAMAYENAGDMQNAKHMRQLVSMAKNNPEMLKMTLALSYSALAPKDSGQQYKAIQDGIETSEMLEQNKDKARSETAKNYAQANKHLNDIDVDNAKLPYEQASLQAGATKDIAQGNKLKIEANFIPKQFDLEQRKAELNNQIALLETQLKAENNAIEKEKLQAQLQDIQLKRDMLISEKRKEHQKRAAEYELARNNFESSKALIRKMLNNKGGLDGATGAFDGRTPTFLYHTREFEQDVDTLKSQKFLNMIQQMRGMGALSNAEGLKLETAIASLDLKGSEETIVKQLTTIYDHFDRLQKISEIEYADVVNALAENQTGTIQNRSYMQFAQ